MRREGEIAFPACRLPFRQELDRLALAGAHADFESRMGQISPWWHYQNDPETRRALDLIFDNHFIRDELGLFEPIREILLGEDDYMHLAGLASYVRAQERVSELYSNQDAWSEKAIINLARSGKFSSDRAISEYAADIWNAKPCPVPVPVKGV